VYHLLHDLSSGVDRHEIVAGVDQVSRAAAAEESAATAFPAPTTGSATHRSFSGTQIYFARRPGTETALSPATGAGSRIGTARGAHRVITLPPDARSNDAVAQAGRAERPRSASQVPGGSVQTDASRPGQSFNGVSLDVGDHDSGCVSRRSRRQPGDQLRAEARAELEAISALALKRRDGATIRFRTGE